MQAWRVTRPGPLSTRPLRLSRELLPRPTSRDLLVRVLACGVCRTDLHVVAGELAPHRLEVVPGHEVVGEIVAMGDDVPTSRFTIGQRVGIAWLRGTCGHCRYCVRGDENLCPYSTYTGWDADGGYGEYATVPADFALDLPTGYPVVELAPLLCAGIIGYRALSRAELPDGGRLGIYGFGGSAHLTAQVALARGARVHVMTRGEEARRLAFSLGASSVQGTCDPPPEPLDAAILFAPVGELVPPALAALDAGGTLALAGIHVSDIPALNYQQHLFRERQIRSVTANTRQDAREFLAVAQKHRLRVSAHRYPLDAADVALADLAGGVFGGAAVLVP
ncbi:zinc-binding alcohol dehydrogenase family protein [Prescottella sp. R16]|uniref:zinc-binding alcohol dehydrogenase family protein n=1 Tax=Prescottella sp. R16 TaxID=3064529 RepID=UPI00272DD505|nr:zinc-binding alcohol dehydrogenase family protein [Prescottella sp. R16]